MERDRTFKRVLSDSDTDSENRCLSGLPKSRTNRRAKKSSRQIDNQNDNQHKLIDDAIDAVVSQCVADDPQEQSDLCKSIELSTEVSKLQCEISQLNHTVIEQSRTIDRLSKQLHFVLSYLEIVDNTGTTDSSQIVSVSTQSAVVVDPDPVTAKQSSDNHNSTILPTKTTYSSIIRSTKDSTKYPMTTARSAAVAAIYIEQNTKKRRASSLVVSGLPIDTQQKDVNIFSQLCSTEFDIRPDIVTTRRLGKPAAGKIQPLLVALRSTDEAKLLIELARQLRHSTNTYVRDNVYINANLTRAEAEAAYLLRVQRRQSALRKRSSANVDDGAIDPRIDAATSTHSIPLTAHPSSALQTDNVYTSGSTSTLLTASAAAFVPSTSTSQCE